MHLLLFPSQIFDKLKQEQPGFLSKVTIICGDCSKKKLGISDENLKLLQTNVNVIFHTAAIVNFEASLAQAVLSNVCATKEFLELATSFGELEVCFNVVSQLALNTSLHPGLDFDRIYRSNVINLNPTSEIQTLFEINYQSHIQLDVKA